MTVTDTDTEHLIGTRCPSCERSYYPPRDLCPQCYREPLEPAEIPRDGVLATWTVVRMAKRFPTPYALCYADFPGDVRVLGRVVDWQEGMTLRPGMPVRTHAITVDDGGRPRTTEHTFTVGDGAEVQR